MDIVKGTRASDADREQFVALLQKHLSDGRIDLAEYDTRVAHVYAAATVDELKGVLADLPAVAPPVPVRPRVPIWQRIELSAWLSVSLLNVAIWGVVCLGTGSLIYFWPVWVIGPWGVVLLLRVLSGVEAGRGPARPRRARRPRRAPRRR